MAIDFNGTNSRLIHTTATGMQVATKTIVCWVYADGVGEVPGDGEGGRVVVIDEANKRPGLLHASSANTYVFWHQFTTTDGKWTFTANDGQWNAIAVSYDRGSTSNDPTVRVNFTSVGTTETSTPAGSASANSTGYCIGDMTGVQSATFDGRIAHVQVFNVLLTAAEMDAALRVPGSVRRGLVWWLPMWNASHTEELVSSQNGTATALANGASPPVANLAASYASWFGAFTGVAAAPTAKRLTLLGVG